MNTVDRIALYERTIARCWDTLEIVREERVRERLIARILELSARIAALRWAR